MICISRCIHKILGSATATPFSRALIDSPSQSWIAAHVKEFLAVTPKSIQKCPVNAFRFMGYYMLLPHLFCNLVLGSQQPLHLDHTCCPTTTPLGPPQTILDLALSFRSPHETTTVWQAPQELLVPRGERSTLLAAASPGNSLRRERLSSL